jgi:hypothetical protein
MLRLLLLKGDVPTKETWTCSSLTIRIVRTAEGKLVTWDEERTGHFPKVYNNVYGPDGRIAERNVNGNHAIHEYPSPTKLVVTIEGKDDVTTYDLATGTPSNKKGNKTTSFRYHFMEAQPDGWHFVCGEEDCTPKENGALECKNGSRHQVVATQQFDGIHYRCMPIVTSTGLEISYDENWVRTGTK